MLWTPRSGIVAPRRPPPRMQLPYGVAGTSPVGVHSRLAAAPTITRATTRHYRSASGAVTELAANLHCCEDTGSGRYVSAYAARTNKVLNSDNFAAVSWTAGGTAAVATDDAASPKSGTSADKLSAIGATYSNYVASNTCAFTANAPLALGLWVKRVSTSGYLDIMNGYEPGSWTVNLAALPDAWVRLTRSSSYVSVVADFAADASGNANVGLYSNDAIIAFHCWNVVLEETSSLEAGPDIITAGAAVSSAADVIALAVDDYGIPGSVELEVRSYDSTPTNKRLWSWYDADGDGAIELFLDASGHPHLRVHSGAGETVDSEVATAVIGGAWHRIRASWETNNCALSVDGGTPARDTSCAMPTQANLDASRLGASESGQYLDGDIREFRAYPYRRL